MTITINITDSIPKYIEKWGVDYHWQLKRATELYEKDPAKALKEYPEFEELLKPKKQKGK